MVVPRLLRLFIALLALGCAMASPASAAAAMSKRIMPCHEAAVSLALAAPAASTEHDGHVAVGAMAGQGGTLMHPPGPDAVRLHMCCVLSQLMAPPLVLPGLTVPAARMAALSLPDIAPLPGLAWPAPVPPPRTV